MSLLPLVRIWIWLSVIASAAGWILSALGQLNRVGYIVFFLGVGALIWLLKKFSRSSPSEREVQRKPWNWRKLRWRFRRGLPGCFVLLAFLIFLGGAMYAPSTHTALTYRTPLVLQWLTEGRWHWIH